MQLLKTQKILKATLVHHRQRLFGDDVVGFVPTIRNKVVRSFRYRLQRAQKLSSLQGTEKTVGPLSKFPLLIHQVSSLVAAMVKKTDIPFLSRGLCGGSRWYCNFEHNKKNVLLLLESFYFFKQYYLVRLAVRHHLRCSGVQQFTAIRLGPH